MDVTAATVCAGHSWHHQHATSYQPKMAKMTLTSCQGEDKMG